MKFRYALVNSFEKMRKELGQIFRDITFADNFTSFEITLEIAANTEEKIRNQLTIRPSGYIIKKQIGNALVTAGDTVWDDTFLYIKNHDSTNSVTITIIFIR